jgi:hypothetical protein
VTGLTGDRANGCLALLPSNLFRSAGGDACNADSSSRFPFHASTGLFSSRFCVFLRAPPRPRSGARKSTNNVKKGSKRSPKTTPKAVQKHLPDPIPHFSSPDSHGRAIFREMPARSDSQKPSKPMCFTRCFACREFSSARARLTDTPTKGHH